jgi:DNA repair exonuclease SbcCD ATPase subunit
LTSLTAIFGNSPTREADGSAESEKLLDLYWNRAELKKEFAALRDEKYRLQNRIKEEKGATARVRQKLEHLENLLGDPDWVYNVVVHYQLRALDRRCQRKLAKFAEELKQQREQKQHRQLLQDWREQVDLELKAMQREIGKQRRQLQLLEDQLQVERHRLASMGPFLRLFRRRSVMSAVDAVAAKIEAAQVEERELLLKFDDLQSSQPPDTQGLNISTKRIINFMILAFAQHLYLHFRADSIALLAKGAAEKSVGAVSYGTKKECDDILATVKRRLDKLEGARDFADILRQRARLIGERALFRSDEDAVPKGGTVATLYVIDARGSVNEEAGVDLLGQNYWKLAEIVSR